MALTSGQPAGQRARLPRNASADGLPAGAVQTRTDFGKAWLRRRLPATRPRQAPLSVHRLGAGRGQPAAGWRSQRRVTGYMLRQHALGQAQLSVHYSR